MYKKYSNVQKEGLMNFIAEKNWQKPNTKRITTVRITFDQILYKYILIRSYDQYEKRVAVFNSFNRNNNNLQNNNCLHIAFKA